MKKMIVLLVMAFAATTAFSQTFMHGAGVNIFVSKVSGADASVYGGFSYSPRVTFLETETLSLSAGIPLSIGLAGSYSYNSDLYGSEEENSLRFMLNAPLIVDLNIGAGSTKENESRFGFFVGGGFGLHYGDFLVIKEDEGRGYSYQDKASSTTYGPAGNVGFRLAVGSHQKNIETKFSFMKGINDYKPTIFGVNVSFLF
ncbi:MAG: hypothetical protein QM731_04365 [Chitinophagaceae bacterium]